MPCLNERFHRRKMPVLRRQVKRCIASGGSCFEVYAGFHQRRKSPQKARAAPPGGAMYSLEGSRFGVYAGFHQRHKSPQKTRTAPPGEAAYARERQLL